MALGYSDIFYENCFKNGVLPIVLKKHDHERLVQCAGEAAPYFVTVDVEAGKVESHEGEAFFFDLDERKRALLMSGLDEIGSTLAASERIQAFREHHRQGKPWLYE